MPKNSELINQIKDLLYAAGVKDPTMRLRVTSSDKSRILVVFFKIGLFECELCNERSRLDRLISLVRLEECAQCSVHWDEERAAQAVMTARARKALENHVTMEAPSQRYRETSLIVVP